MAKSVFFLTGSDPKKEQSIRLRFFYGQKRTTYSTGYKIQPKYWDNENQRIRNRLEIWNRDEINTALIDLKQRFDKAYFNLKKDGKEITNDLLLAKVENRTIKKEKTNESSPIVQTFLDEYIKNAPTTIIQKADGTTEPLKKNTIKQFTTTLNHLKAYDKKKRAKTMFTDLDLKFHKKFTQYLITDKHLAMQTVASRIKDLKTISKHALREGVEVCNDVFTRDFFKPTDKSYHVYLNDSEIQQVFNFDFTKDERLDNVRDLFIIGLRTGLRISDFTRLKEANINQGFISIEAQQKTGDPVIIPLHPQIEIILEKRKGNLPRIISHTKFNEYIKEVCSKVGLTQLVKGTKHSEKKEVVNKRTGKKTEIYRKETGLFPKFELISSHTCRRSFATNLYGKLPNMVIMAITGHKSEQTFLKYVKITPKEHAETLRAHWMKQIKENNQTVLMAKV